MSSIKPSEPKPSSVVAVGGTLGLLLCVALAVALPNPTSWQVLVFWVALIVSAGAVGTALPGDIQVQHPKLAKATGSIALAVFVALITRPLVERVRPQEHTPKSQPTAQPSAPVAAATWLACNSSFHQQILCDFQDLNYRYFESRELIFSDGPARLEIYAFKNPKIGAEVFVALLHASTHLYEVAGKVISEHKQLLTELTSQMPDVTATRRGEQGSMSSGDTKFTGRIYLYYEGILTLQQQAELERQAQSLGATVNFRGYEYLTSTTNKVPK